MTWNAENDTDESVASIATAALDLSEDERDGFLISACAGDEALRELVEQFVSKASAADQFFGELADRVGLSWIHESPVAPMADRHLGVYRLIERIGEGGMGQVYLAERTDDQFEQQVAIKILPSRFASAELKNRFIAERQILARLAHPNIARLLDGGVDDQGSPFIVMEYIAGTRIDQYCNDRALSVDERIRLFMQVCDAVGYAHRSMIVHRDLKPSNVLVDDDGTVKLLDFGIAKLLEDDAAQDLTRTGLQPMTLRYASPEMIRGEPVDTSSDVYSLGVLLYEIVVGVSPYSLEPMTDAETQAAIVEADIASPSRVLANLAGSDVDRASALAQQRSTSVEAFQKNLKSDLETIVLSALKRDPNQRYRSAQAIKDDLSRYREHLPIDARSATLRYTVGKFVRRHTLAAGLMAASVASLVVIALLATAYSVTTSRQAEVIARERDRAESIQSFLLSLFEESSPNEAKGQDVSAKEMLGRGAERIDRELAGQPESAALMKVTIASIYGQLGLYDDALSLLNDALVLRRDHNGARSAEVADIMEQIALVSEVSGDLDRALSVAREALHIALETDELRVVAKIQMRIGRILHVQGLLEESRPHYEAALLGLTETTGAGSAETSMVTSMIAGLYGHLGDFPEAERLHKRAIANYRALFGDEHIETIGAIIAFGQTEFNARQYEASVDTMQMALRLNEKLLGGEHRDNFFIFNTMALGLMELGRLNEAQLNFERAREIVLQYFGDEHLSYGFLLSNLGTLASRKGDCHTALELYTRARVVFEATVADHWGIAVLDARVGECEMKQGNDVAAERFISSSVTRLREVFGDEHVRTQKSLALMVEYYDKVGRAETAAEYRQLIAP